MGSLKKREKAMEKVTGYQLPGNNAMNNNSEL
jgi:hypothetical protein